MTSIRVPPRLDKFYIFDSRYGQKEGEEHEKLLFYFPSSDTLNNKSRNIGLSEAYTRFTNMFTKDSDCDAVFSQKHCSVLLQPEPFVWIVMKACLAYSYQQEIHSDAIKQRQTDGSDKKSRTKGRKTSSPVNLDAKRTQLNENSSPASQTSNEEYQTPIARRSNHDVLDDSSRVTSGPINCDVQGNNDGNGFSVMKREDTSSCSDETTLAIPKNKEVHSSRESFKFNDTLPCKNGLSDSSDACGECCCSQPSDGKASNPAEEVCSSLENNLSTFNICTTAKNCQYDPSSLQPSVLRSHLHAAYSAFSLHHHSFAHSLEKYGIVGLRQLLSQFFEQYLKDVDVVSGDISSVWGGISYLPLSQPNFLRVHCCLSALKTALPCITATAFICSSNVVWCDLDLESLRKVYHFLYTSKAFDKASKSASVVDAPHAQRFIGGLSSRHQVFVSTVHRHKGGCQAATGHCRCPDSRSLFHLLLYTCSGIIVPIFIPEAERITPTLYEKIAKFLDSRVVQLSADLTDTRTLVTSTRHRSSANARASDGAGSFRYVYHNDKNLAIKSTMLVECDPALAMEDSTIGVSFTRSSAMGSYLPSGPIGGVFGLGGSGVFTTTEGAAVVPWKVMQCIVDMQADVVRNDLSEVVLKTVDDHWVVGRSGNGRQLFLTIAHPSANLVEITDEVLRMCNAHFKDVFMLE